MDNELRISEEEGDVIDILLCPNKTPIVYTRKKKELIESSGMTEDEAEEYLQQPIPLELFYDYNRGLFGVESGAVGETEIYNPYTGREIPKEN